MFEICNRKHFAIKILQNVTILVILRPHVVRLGEYIKGRIIDCQGKLCNKDGTQNIEVRKVLPHPGYKPAPDWKNDICLLGLKTPAKLSGMKNR